MSEALARCDKRRQYLEGKARRRRTVRQMRACLASGLSCVCLSRCCGRSARAAACRDCRNRLDAHPRLAARVPVGLAEPHVHAGRVCGCVLVRVW